MVRQAGAHRPRGRRRSNECRIRGNLEGKLFQRNGRSGICGENNIDMEEARVSISIIKMVQPAVYRVPTIVRKYNYDGFTWPTSTTATLRTGLQEAGERRHVRQLPHRLYE
ncbi:hypothetical protein PF005_g6802 [Phytophthora fragariae]|uniref:Uncharacterized protein n=1 Tax=Phytophthora fragariae TaxID=53985 RepID=A0A6A3FCU4_9STRA|nr:hypothetical protein PF003_g13096 [Phytophthora fragariae]KAE8942953.1 hypothetical protein PF009_g7311 [Phytophthora fragariae]KAE9021457.1 hypothetical protein PF011_g4935 [Phytophthora fragariae]KAE9124042.1 hypothetical protein PF007_g6851 [Phytophthora fragariae]KAE9150516.1 hypothetical protein PF006_g5112 [Phytophthora fragariae]